MKQHLTLTGNAQSHQSQTYAHLPFTVPEKTTRIDVHYTYSDAVSSDPQITDGNTIDIGIFDTRGCDFMTDGFRGWSGSARDGFFIANNEATPGYLSGPLQAGTWYICLGLYKIATQGCHYEVNITIEQSDTAPQVDFPALLPIRQTTATATSDHWYRGEIHCHTFHSDGDSSPQDVIDRAKALGLNFLAITDHNVLSHLAELNTLNTDFVIIPGFEVTTYKGHWNVWGEGHYGWIDFRVQNADQMAEALAEAARRGYVVSGNHPRPYGPDWAYPEADGFDCIEVWNGDWALFNDMALAFWEERLRQGKRYTAVGGSDSHFLKREHIARLGHPTLWAYCPEGLSAQAVLQALRAGHVSITAHPEGPRLILRSEDALMGDALSRPTDNIITIAIETQRSIGYQLEVHTANGCIYTQNVDTSAENYLLEFPINTTPYIRVQLTDPATGAVHAITNPLYFHKD